MNILIGIIIYLLGVVVSYFACKLYNKRNKRLKEEYRKKNDSKFRFAYVLSRKVAIVHIVLSWWGVFAFVLYFDPATDWWETDF